MPLVPGREERKQWEVAMALATFTEFVSAPEPCALGVGAGVEPTGFWLTTRCREVHATDLYGTDPRWKRSALPEMLTDPASIEIGIDWNARRLIVQHMDARALRYDDERFDFVYSSSSLEHFGSLEDMARAMGEIGRVLRPGGVLSLSTEYRIEGRPDVVENTRLLDAQELQSLIEASGLEPLSKLDLELDDTPAVSFKRAWRDIARKGGLREFPHIVLELAGARWTSVHLALGKGPRP